MLYKEYGHTGKKISAVGFGGMRFANPEDIEANAAVMLHAYRRGINYFDTAPYYCKDKSEDIFGAAIAQMDRNGIYVSTKCAAPNGDELRKSLEKSLKRMGVQKIDFFHIWCVLTPDEWKERKTGGAVSAAVKAKEEGLIGHLAVSSHLNGNELAEVLAEGVFEGVTLGYNVLNFPYRQQAVEAAGKCKLGVVTMNPLAGGLIPQNPRRFDFINSSPDESVVAAALRFIMSQPAITSALVGFTTIKQIDQAVEAAENFQPYPAAHMAALRDKITATFDGMCTGCEYCLPCPAGVAIPKMMDCYNITLLGKKPKDVVNRMKWHWNLPLDMTKTCTLCGACEDRCTQHLPIRNRMKEIGEIVESQNKAGEK